MIKDTGDNASSDVPRVPASPSAGGEANGPDQGSGGRASVLLAALAERRPALIDLGLERMIMALGALGDPHKNLPPTIHVAGTNGKGSTIAYMRAILQAAGKTVHVYTSPHLVRFNERIVLAGKEISNEALIDVITRCDEAVQDQELTYFEAVTCAAFLAFSETPADVLLLEVGLGGRLDATNVIRKPLASVVTPVALDHQQFLGDDVATIAGEKAGIFKSGARAVIGQQSATAMAVLEEQAMKTGAEPFKYGEDWHVFEEQGRLVFQDDEGLSDLVLPRLTGAHQINNAGLAIAALRAADLCPDDQTVSQGLVNALWPGRMQQLRFGPFVDRLEAATGDTADLWLDGGHNPHAARALASVIADLEERLPRPVYLIAGLQKQKDLGGFFEALTGLVACVYSVRSEQDNAAPIKQIEKAARDHGHVVQTAQTASTALEQILERIKADKTIPRVVIAGSLYLAGEILTDHG
ncbi:MAG: folylpolyglutamate synthase/dihydrofolate synthase family protein [Pseudomonadota bacterium]